MAHFDDLGRTPRPTADRRTGIDVVRLGYADLIGTDRGRDILVNRFARTAGRRRRVLPLGLRHHARWATSSTSRAACRPGCPTSWPSPT